MLLQQGKNNYDEKSSYCCTGLRGANILSITGFGQRSSVKPAQKKENPAYFAKSDQTFWLQTRQELLKQDTQGCDLEQRRATRFTWLLGNAVL